jgi:hypothetical protein
MTSLSSATARMFWPGRERQHGISPIERLDGGLFIHAEHVGMLRRMEIEPNDVRRGASRRDRVLAWAGRWARAEGRADAAGWESSES